MNSLLSFSADLEMKDQFGYGGLTISIWDNTILRETISSRGISSLDGKMGQHGQIPSKPYNKTVTVKFIDKETMEFEFDVDTWIVTKR